MPARGGAIDPTGMSVEQRQPSRGDEAQCGTAVYWFWSRAPERAEAERQVRQMAEAGIELVMIQARLSMDLGQYMSEEYLRGYRGAVEAAAAAGLKVGIYDEYNWMSGHGGGRTVEGSGHLRERVLFWSTAPAEDRRVSAVRRPPRSGARGG